MFNNVHVQNCVSGLRGIVNDVSIRIGPIMIGIVNIEYVINSDPHSIHIQVRGNGRQIRVSVIWMVNNAAVAPTSVFPWTLHERLIFHSLQGNYQTSLFISVSWEKRSWHRSESRRRVTGIADNRASERRTESWSPRTVDATDCQWNNLNNEICRSQCNGRNEHVRWWKQRRWIGMNRNQ